MEAVQQVKKLTIVKNAGKNEDTYESDQAGGGGLLTIIPTS